MVQAATGWISINLLHEWHLGVTTEALIGSLVKSSKNSSPAAEGWSLIPISSHVPVIGKSAVCY